MKLELDDRRLPIEGSANVLEYNLVPASRFWNATLISHHDDAFSLTYPLTYPVEVREFLAKDSMNTIPQAPYSLSDTAPRDLSLFPRSKIIASWIPSFWIWRLYL